MDVIHSLHTEARQDLLVRTKEMNQREQLIAILERCLRSVEDREQHCSRAAGLGHGTRQV